MPIFEQVAQYNGITISTATDQDMARLFKLTFESIAMLLDVDLDLIPEKNVFDAKDALNRLLKEYRKFRSKSIDQKIAVDIDNTLPMLREAVVQINAAAIILRDTAGNKVERRESIQLYSRPILNCLDQIDQITAIL